MEKMLYKKTLETVNVYSIVGTDAYIFSEHEFNCNNCGIHKVSLKNLLPVECKDLFIKSKHKEEMNVSARSRIKMIHAVFECTDGTQFNNQSQAIEHEDEIILKELENLIINKE